MWDNRYTNHRAVGEVAEPPNIRRMHRTTLSGAAISADVTAGSQ